MPRIDPIVTALSPRRLDLGFRGSPAEPYQTILARYLYNAACCEALYPVLHVAEVAVRNSLDRVIAAHYPCGTPRRAGPDGLPCAGSWLDATPSLLAVREQDNVRAVKRRLLAERKQVTHDRLVAGLSFGFWCGLFTRYYEISPASAYTPGAAARTALWPRHLRAVFPHLPKRFSTRDHASRALQSIAQLRNQVFHHRPVWRSQLNTLHVAATEVIGWIEPELQRLVLRADRFSAVCGRGVAWHECDLRSFLCVG